jgi:hypothetical protein
LKKQTLDWQELLLGVQSVFIDRSLREILVQDFDDSARMKAAEVAAYHRVFRWLAAPAEQKERRDA